MIINCYSTITKIYMKVTNTGLGGKVIKFHYACLGSPGLSPFYSLYFSSLPPELGMSLSALLNRNSLVSSSMNLILLVLTRTDSFTL